MNAKDVDATVMDITPDVARLLLSKNDSNRPVRGSRVDHYAEQMKSGKWLFNGDAIRVAEDGTLLDGQHRLMAVVKSGATIKALLITGLDNEVFKTIDQGAKRTPGDIFSLKGIPNATNVAASCNLLLRWHNKNIHWASSVPAAPDELLQTYMIDPEGVQAGARLAHRSGLKKLVAPAITSFFYVVMKRDRSEGIARQFLEELDSGIVSYKDSPVYVLRERLQDNRASTRKMRRPEIVALFCKAYLKFRDGETAKLIRWKSNEEFPYF